LADGCCGFGTATTATGDDDDDDDDDDPLFDERNE
jgi:hypothetical protein